VQSLDPAGVGARSAAECLALQIRRMPGVPMVTRRMALTIVERYLTWFAQREFNKLKKALDCDDEDLREAQAVIRQCNPHPGAAFASTSRLRGAGRDRAPREGWLERAAESRRDAAPAREQRVRQPLLKQGNRSRR
jgi:hypothetical protein